MVETVQINELTKRIAEPPQLYWLAATQLAELQCRAVIQIMEIELGFPMVQFLSENIDVS